MDLTNGNNAERSCLPSAKRPKLEMKQISLETVLEDELIDDVPLVDVFVAAITDPKSISKVIINLNSRLPVGELQHLKHIRNKEVLLCPCSWVKPQQDQNISQFLTDKEVLLEALDLTSVNVKKVASVPPRTKRQYKVANQLWPCNFHSDKYLERLVTNTLFTTPELAFHKKMLDLAMKVSTLHMDDKSTICGIGKKDDCSGNCGVVVVDPTRDNLLIAAGYSMLQVDPTLHSTMVAVDAVARTQHGGAFPNLSSEIDWNQLLTGQFQDVRVLKRSAPKHSKFSSKENDYRNEENANVRENEIVTDEISEDEYLCTNYHVYMTHEPCIMCAMALIHSRVKRVFYIFPTQRGALGSLCKVHTVKDLNHHYEVFKVADECLAHFSS